MPALVDVLEAIDRPFVMPLHPRTRAALERTGLLERAAAAGTLAPPLGYLDFTALLASASVCLTDSGGVQKEAYMHRVPCLTLRDTSEWVETIHLGWNRLTGLDADGGCRRTARPRSTPDASAAVRNAATRPTQHRRGDRRPPVSAVVSICA